ncbi:MAG: threonine--tRNA ligase [Myxococcales bacterium]|nr:threonine--tRNA ligase [Myxococcales bacterium]
MDQQRRTGRQLLAEQEKLGNDVVAVEVGGQVFDLHTPLPEGTSEVRAIRQNDPKALPIIRHSTAHVMADAVQKLFPGTKVAFGPATEAGFFYDYDRPGGSFSEADLEAIEQKMLEIIESDSPFVREPMAREDLMALLSSMNEPYKLEHVQRLEGELTIYRHGDWVDLCEGPHVPSTRFLKAFKLTHTAGAYWRGDERNPMLQRIYGTAFASPKDLKAHLKALEEAKLRDHRKVGKELDLIAFHPLAPASPFFTARGARIYNALCDYVRELYDRHGYEEVITPQVFDNELFETSGHLPAYYENMFLAASKEHLEKAAKEIVEKPPADVHACEHVMTEHFRFGVKPMNCPSHCLLFGMKRRSYRELPLRIADFGRLHRYERSGVVQGLTRVRTFAQDDAHIFCTQEQVSGEIADFIDLVHRVYEDFAFQAPKIYIATRPDKRIGDDAVWDAAEKALIDGVSAKGVPFEIAEGEGAFYGPKVEFHLKDALGRSWQLGTIQADFNLPERFDLSYVGANNESHRPVMLHRAVLGSVERFFGVLIEHVGGNFPTWLAPEQLTIVTVASDFDAFAVEAAKELRRKGLRVSVDTSNERLGAKIRAARLMRVPYIGVVGAKEVEGRGLQLRSRDLNADVGFSTLDEVAARLLAEHRAPSLRD